MTEITFQSADQEEVDTIALEQNESVLDGLLRAGHDIAFGCRAGVCQSCIMQTSSESVPAVAQVGLKDSQKTLGYFLPCVCQPTEKMDVSKLVLASTKVSARVLEKKYLNAEVLCLRLEKKFDYKPGQYCTLWKGTELGRCYSIASHNVEDDFIEFHIRKIENGEFSQWAFDSLEIGESVDVQGPLGTCFYTKSESAQPLLLAGIGTGLAPLYGILKDALFQGHNATINLFVGAKDAQNFYLLEELLALEKKFKQLNVHLVAQNTQNFESELTTVEDDIYSYTESIIKDFKGQQVFLCGAQTFVHKMKRMSFLGGANMSDILADVFLAFNK